MPATLAILSIVFVESAYSAAGITGEADRIEHKLFAVLILIIMSTANSISTKASTSLNNVFVLVKFLTIAIIVLAGIAVVGIHIAHPHRDAGGVDWYKRSWFGSRPSVNPDGSKTHWEELSQWEMLGHYSAALYAALWAYSGWDKVCCLPRYARSFYLTKNHVGCICIGRTFSARKAVAAGHQQRTLSDHCIFPRSERCFLHSSAVVSRGDDR